MYNSIHQFEPLLPEIGSELLLKQAAKIVRASVSLDSTAHSTARDAVRELVRSMNSYYSNRIEGQGTHPLNIERALRSDFSEKPDIAKLQHIAVAHIEAEKELEERVKAGVSALKSDFLIAAHAALYSRLREEDRTVEDGHVIVPGAIRTENVEVGRHIPPIAGSIPSFLKRMDDVYGREMGWDMQLIAIACLHHRATWVHPFRDGNGRSARLQSHCALWELSGGLWSPNRGLARARQDYYVHLQNADGPRRGDLDGRGNLTSAGLREWVKFFLDVCEDQVTFMTNMLDLDGMKRRIEGLISYRAAIDSKMRREAILPLHHVFSAGPVSRGEFTQLTGLGERTASNLIKHLLNTKLLVSDTPKGPVRFGLPLDALQFLLPELYPEADTSPN